jgi:hypothetical protein
MLNYWVVVVKGISLLQMAYDAPNVDFFEGMLTIRRQKDKLDSQEQTFKSVVGQNTIRLVELALPGLSSTPVRLLSHEGLWMGANLLSGFGGRSSFVGFRSNCVALNGSLEYPDIDRMLSKWEMRFDFGSDAGIRHAVRFVCSGKYLAHASPDVLLVRINSQFSRCSVSWFVKPVCPGSDRYTIRAARDILASPDNFHSFRLRRRQEGSGILGSHLVARLILELEYHVSSSDAGAKFQIKV